MPGQKSWNSFTCLLTIQAEKKNTRGEHDANLFAEPIEYTAQDCDPTVSKNNSHQSMQSTTDLL